MRSSASLRSGLILTLSIAAALAAPIVARAKAPSNAKAEVPDALQKVEARYKEAGSLQASFEQEEVSKALGDTKKSQGKIAWKAPNRLKWETETPDPNLLVSDGKTMWFYTPPFDESEKGQVIIRKAAQMKNRLIDALLAGRFSSAVKQGLRIEALPENTFKLLPRKGTVGGLKVAQVKIEPEKHQIVQVSLEYRDGNRSSIDLKDIELGKGIPMDQFEFKIPPRTDIVKQ
jgi:outer membrane lipoprotein carrier protein